MTHAWVVLLRAVNLGGRNKVPMPELRAVLAREGYASVRTYIASGNVLLAAGKDRAAVARSVERLIAERFGVETLAIVRTPRELAAVAAAHPFGDDTSRTHVSFLAGAPEQAAAERLAEADHGSDRVHLAGSDVYLQYPDGVQRARLSAAKLERLLGVPGTARNWRTVTALADLAGA